MQYIRAHRNTLNGALQSPSQSRFISISIQNVPCNRHSGVSVLLATPGTSGASQASCHWFSFKRFQHRRVRDCDVTRVPCTLLLTFDPDLTLNDPHSSAQSGVEQRHCVVNNKQHSESRDVTIHKESTPIESIGKIKIGFKQQRALALDFICIYLYNVEPASFGPGFYLHKKTNVSG